MVDAADARLVAEMVGIILFTTGGGGAALLYVRRKNGSSNAQPSMHLNGHGKNQELTQSEILRQHLHDQRHGETIRILGDVTETVANSAKASERAAVAAERAAGSTERLSIAVERHLDKCRP